MTAEMPATAPPPRAHGRLVVLDGLRLLAAVMVVFYHYVGVPNANIGRQGHTKVLAWGTSAANVFPHFLYQSATYGWTGVELFFMISGFVICMSGWGRKPADFFVSRVVRIVPAYWAATVLTAAVLMAFPRMTAGIKPSMVLTNLTMVQSAYGIPNLVPAYWTLFVELSFYLLFGLVAIGGITYRRMVTFCVLWSVASIAAANSHDPVLMKIINPPYSSFFIAGIAFFLIYKFGSNFLLWAIASYSWLISVNQPHTAPPWQVVVLISSFFVIMALVATHRLDAIRWPWLTVAGALTYPLYLIHQDIGFTIFTYLRSYVPATALVALTFAAMVGLAWLIHRGVERPTAPVLKAKLSEAVARVRLTGLPAAPSVAGLGTQAGAAAARDPGMGDPGMGDAGIGHGPARCGGTSRHRATRLHPRRAMPPPPAGSGANGSVANGSVANGSVANGSVANGSVANGAGVNGAGVHGAGVNGTGANGTPANGTPANGTGGNGTAASQAAAADDPAASPPGPVSETSGSPR